MNKPVIIAFIFGIISQYFAYILSSGNLYWLPFLLGGVMLSLLLPKATWSHSLILAGAPILVFLWFTIRYLKGEYDFFGFMGLYSLIIPGAALLSLAGFIVTGSVTNIGSKKNEQTENQAETIKISRLSKKTGTMTSVIVLLTLIHFIVSFKLYLVAPSEKDYFLADVAYDFDAPEICENINRWAHHIKGGEDIYFRSECYTDLAVKFHNTDLCNHIISLRTPETDRRNYQNYCYTLISRGVPPSHSYAYGKYDPDKMMVPTGFPYYSRVKNGTAEEKKRFLDAVRRL